MISEAERRDGAGGVSGQRTPAQVKAALLAWADATDRVSKKRWLGRMILAGGAAAVVGCSAMACMPTSRRMKQVQQVPRPQRAERVSGRGIWPLLTIALQAYRLAGPVVREYARKRSMARRSGGVG